MRASAEEARIRAEKEYSLARKQKETARYHDDRTQKALASAQARNERLQSGVRETARQFLNEQLSHQNTQKEKSELNSRFMSLLRVCAYRMDASNDPTNWKMP